MSGILKQLFSWFGFAWIEKIILDAWDKASPMLKEKIGKIVDEWYQRALATQTELDDPVAAFLKELVAFATGGGQLRYFTPEILDVLQQGLDIVYKYVKEETDTVLDDQFVTFLYDLIGRPLPKV